MVWKKGDLIYRVQKLFFSVTTYYKNKPNFINSLPHLIKENLLESILSTVDVSGIFIQEDCFNLDAHINEKDIKK